MTKLTDEQLKAIHAKNNSSSNKPSSTQFNDDKSSSAKIRGMSLNEIKRLKIKGTVPVLKVIQELEGDDVTIKEVNDGHNTVSGTGKYLELTNGATYNLYNDYDEMENEARERIEQDLDEGLFNQDFLAYYIDVDNLRDMLFDDVYSRNYDRLTDENDDEDSTSIEDEARRMTDEELEDPLQYMDDIYGREEGMIEAMRIGGIDRDGAIQGAIDADGVEHFISGYDGQAHETTNGQYLVKHND